MTNGTQQWREQWAGTVFTTWVVLGLFLDGWAHNAGKPENFWTPWHALLYSGFVIGAGWFAYERQRKRKDGQTDRGVDPLLLVGFAVFAVAGLGDMTWHSVFGVEEDVAALLSPTHLALMIGGVLLVTGPIRSAREVEAPHRSWRTFAPIAVAVVLTVAVIGFFLQFLSAFHVHDTDIFTAPSAGGTLAAMHGVASVLVSNLLLIAGLAWTLTRWRRPPVGTCTAVLAGPALLFSSLHGFAYVWLVGAPLLGGIATELLVVRSVRRGTLLGVASGVTWSAWFAIYQVVWGVGWEVEFWTGTIVFAALTAVGVELLLGAAQGPVAAPRSDESLTTASPPAVAEVAEGRPAAGVAGSSLGPMRHRRLVSHGDGEQVTEQ